MTVENIREIIKRELPILVSEDEELQDLIRRLYRSEFASRAETNDRFDQLMTELHKDREEQAHQWKEQARRWDENKLELQNDREVNKKEFDRAHEDIVALANKHERAVGALGAR